jgi:LAO/AO transport system kinase
VQLEKLEELVSRFKQKEKSALARLISLIENEPEMASAVFNQLDSPQQPSYIMGITGPPGAGKSSLISQLVEKLTAQGKSVGVISIDPSSPFTGGAFLGDRIRMATAVQHELCFMRSMASRGAVGGLSRATFDTTLLMEAFGFDIIIIETVGAGQSEVDVLKFADTVLVLNVPGLGDSIQCQKAGIIEIGDILVVNKKDLGGEEIAVQLDLMLDDAVMFIGESSWRPPVVQTNSISGEGFDELLEEIWNHKEHITLSGALEEKRRKRIKDKLMDVIRYRIEDHILKEIFPTIEASVLDKLNANKYSVYGIAGTIYETYLSHLKGSEKE